MHVTLVSNMGRSCMHQCSHGVAPAAARRSCQRRSRPMLGARCGLCQSAHASMLSELFAERMGRAVGAAARALHTVCNTHVLRLMHKPGACAHNACHSACEHGMYVSGRRMAHMKKLLTRLLCVGLAIFERVNHPADGCIRRMLRLIDRACHHSKTRRVRRTAQAQGTDAD